MPFFFIPIIVAVAALAGGAATAAGCGRIAGAQDRYRRRRESYDGFIGEFTGHRDRLNASLAELGQVRVDTLPALRSAVEFLRNARLKDRALFDRCDIPVETLDRWESSALKAHEIAAAAGQAALTGAFTAIGAYGAVGALATASTGTAIASLSGVAASNATLAWLGGGTLAAGGGGLALGSAVLGGLVLAPALAVGAFMIHGKACEIETQVAAAIADLDIDEAQKRTAMARMDACQHRIAELREATWRLHDALNTLLSTASARRWKWLARTFPQTRDTLLERLKPFPRLHRTLVGLLTNAPTDEDAYAVARAAKGLAETLEAKALE